MFEKAIVKGWLGGFQVSSNGIRVSHLQFADDTLVFLDADIAQVRYLKYLLLTYAMASGLHTNFAKTSLFAVGDVPNMEALTEIMGCASASFPSSYLGLPLGASSRDVRKWDKIVEMCKARLPTWKRGIVSKGGKLTLIKHVLLSLLVYQFSLFLAPRSVIKQIERTICKFLWDAANGDKKHHWVGLKSVCKPLSQGGLGVRRLKPLNRALLMKWWWRLGKENNALWAKIIHEKYGDRNSRWRTKDTKDLYEVSIWRHINSVANTFFGAIQFKIGTVLRLDYGKKSGVVKESLLLSVLLFTLFQVLRTFPY